MTQHTYTKEELEIAVLECNCLTDVLRYFNIKTEGGHTKTLQRRLDKWNIDISFWDKQKVFDRQKKIVEDKICPKCDSIHQKIGVFCSRKCANTRTHTEETKNKITNSLKEFYTENENHNKGKQNNPVIIEVNEIDRSKKTPGIRVKSKCYVCDEIILLVPSQIRKRNVCKNLNCISECKRQSGKRSALLNKLRVSNSYEEYRDEIAKLDIDINSISEKLYTVYKITNTLSNKYYIGVHLTANPYDNYMGSGIAIKQAILKYGSENFRKEILFVTKDKNEAFEKEKELTKDFNKSNTYNMKSGGVGGFTSENSRKGALKRIELHGPPVGVSIEGRFTSEQLSEFGRKGGLANKGKTRKK